MILCAIPFLTPNSTTGALRYVITDSLGHDAGHKGRAKAALLLLSSIFMVFLLVDDCYDFESTLLQALALSDIDSVSDYLNGTTRDGVTAPHAERQRTPLSSHSFSSILLGEKGPVHDRSTI